MKPSIKLGHIAIVLCAAIAPVVLASQQTAADPFIWLEDVDGKRSMDWVNAHNASTVAELSALPLYQSIYDRTKAILDSKDRIAYPRIVGDMLYNFWQDADHKRGIWRRTSWSDYTSGNPKWATVLDVDALAKAEGVTWSWGGADCFDPEERICMVSLSRGGSDANEAREFDLKTGQFVKDGFRLPEAKMSTAWVDANTLLVGTDYGPGSITTSGYARIVKLWKRGTPLSSATTVYETPAEHMGVFTGASDAGDRRYVVVYDNETFYKGTKSLYRNGRLVKLDIPGDADLHLVRDQMLVYVRDPWEVGGKTWGTGWGDGGCGSNGGGENDWQNELRRFDANGCVGLEWRRVDDARPLVHVARRVQDGDGGRARFRQTILRQHLSGTVHGTARDQRRWVSPGVGASFCEKPKGRSADSSRLRRRQRALPEHRGGSQRAGRGKQAVHDDGVSESHALHLRGGKHDGAPVHDAYEVRGRAFGRW